MTFSNPAADIFVPGGGRTAEEALLAVTHLCVGAHADDIEIMAFSGIADCLDTPGAAFGGVVVTDGAGSPRAGPFAALSARQMIDARREEQRSAAVLGRYALQLQLAHPSADVRLLGHAGVRADLRSIFAGCRPEVVFLHNPADKHDTHVAVLLRCIEAIRSLPEAARPRRVLGCEVWRDLDWLPDDAKVALDCSRHPELAARLLGVFASQVQGGKRYDLAALGRRSANATFHTAHATDTLTAVTWALDLTPATRDGGPTVADLAAALTARFGEDVARRIRAWA